MNLDFQTLRFADLARLPPHKNKRAGAPARGAVNRIVGGARGQ
jgi:hypothetical protein